MTDRPISIKPDHPGQKPLSRLAAGSLAQRVLFMSIALFGLPLLIHTFFLYHREYRENVADALITMRSLAESRALYMEQMIQNQLTILQALVDDLPEGARNKNEFLKNEANEYGVDDLFYVAFDKNQKPVCDDLFCRDPADQPLIQQAIQDGKLVFIVKRADKEESVTITIPVLGPYSPTWPLNCQKSDAIIRQTAALAMQPANLQGIHR